MTVRLRWRKYGCGGLYESGFVCGRTEHMTSASPAIGRVLLAGSILAGVIAVLDSTLIVPLLTEIGNEFDGGSEVAWLVSGYLLAATLTLPMWGRWLDLRGERAPMWTALGLFTVGTALGTCATSLGALIATRVIQGMGAGGLLPFGETIIASRCTPRERARLEVYVTVSYGLAAGMGPVIGGVLTNVSWRYAFAILIPFCAVAAIAFRGRLRRRPAGGADVPMPDLSGTVILAVGVVALLLGVQRLSWGVFAVGVTVLGLFVRRSRSHPHGVIPRSILTNRVIVACGLIGLLIGFAQYAYLTYLPSLAQKLAPAMNPGLVVVPLTVIWVTVGSIGAALALRIGTRTVVLIGLVSATSAGAVLLLSMSVPGLFTAGALIGAATALAVLPAYLLAQFSAAPDELGAATSFIVLLRNCGGTLGVSGALGVYRNFGLVPTIWLLTAVCALVVIPAAMLPGRRHEAQLHLERASRV